MGLLWFVLALVFFILWRVEKSDAKKSNKLNFDVGYEQGSKDLADSIHEKLKNKLSSHDQIKHEVNEVRRKYSGGDATPAEAIPVPLPNQASTDTLDEYAPENYDRNAVAESVPEAIPQAEAVVSTPVPVPVPKTKQQVSERNLNILLYMASFLIVAAAAAFIATSMPPLARLIGLWFVIVVFYGAGLILHTSVPYLRPAAAAFIGTGLALIPFAGIALSQLGGLSGGWAWFITSVIGIGSYLVAALRLKSQIVTYLTIAFTLSLATSTIATFSGPFVLYFVALIFASLIFHILARFNPKWVPELFKLPITQTSQLLTPITLVGSMLAYDTMTLVSYQIVFWVAALYYLVLWITERSLLYETATRVLISLSFMLSIVDLFDYKLTAVLLGIFALAVAQSGYSLLRVVMTRPISRYVEMGWIIASMGILFVTLPAWMDASYTQLGLVTQSLVIFLISIASAHKFRNVLFAIPALFTSILIPFIAGRWPSNEFVSMEALVWFFIAASLIALALSIRLSQHTAAVRGFIMAGFWAYTLVAFFASFAQSSVVAFILSAVGLAISLFIASYIYRQWWIEILSVVLIIPIVSLSFIELEVAYEWMNVLIIGFCAAVYGMLLLAHHSLGETIRRNLVTVAAVVVGGGLVFSYGQPDNVERVVLLIALFYTVIGLVLRRVVTSQVLKVLFTLTYAVYPVMMLLFALSLGYGWLAFALFATAATFWVASYIEKIAATMVFGNIAFVLAVATLWSWLKLDPDWALFGTAWVSGAVFYGTSMFYALYTPDVQRKYIHLVSAWVVLGLAALFFIISDGTYGYAAAGTVVALAGTLAIEGMLTKRTSLVEASIYLSTFGLQRIVGLSMPDLNIVLYGHWWAIIVFATALWLRDQNFTLRLVIAMACITASTGFMALAEGGVYQLLFLCEHVLLLVVGALSRVSWALWWGLAATVLAVLYFLRASLFLSLLFLGLTLLAIVIWRLVRSHKNNSNPS